MLQGKPATALAWFITPSPWASGRNFLSASALIMRLHQPNWRKYLSLNPGRTIVRDDSYFVNGLHSSPFVPVEELPAASSPTNKRKRTDEEIARRKEKKLRSKANKSPQRNGLSNGYTVQHSTELADVGSNQKRSEDITEGDAEAALEPQSFDALLSKKAKEIAKARRDETRNERSTPDKVSQKSDSGSGLERKANEVLKYLKQYHEHVTKGREWKFKKQHQNWILKNLYSYAWKSDALVYQYLKTIQGQAKERLVADAKEVTEAADGTYKEDALRRAQTILTL